MPRQQRLVHLLRLCGQLLTVLAAAVLAYALIRLTGSGGSGPIHTSYLP